MIEANVQQAWDAPVVCRVEVDLPGWMAQLTGRDDWLVLEEEEEENHMSFALSLGMQKAEVTLYHSGYAIVDIDGKPIFQGALTSATSNCAHLSYYNADSGEPITLN
ncbi:MAG: hypothetical protein ACAH12_04925 [Methylophilaceae bacterium]|uniref:hypothetical protein n=1 Tax=Methylovorus sp. MM2 TaxID=1848038 RepID=UPI0007DF7F69|nr:hypothetical protein [Methylovorus sp. MM2]OAM52379.1 hypothetical protein A7981_02535 [Methylovorus sp. MM2]